MGLLDCDHGGGPDVGLQWWLRLGSQRKTPNNGRAPSDLAVGRSKDACGGNGHPAANSHPNETGNAHLADANTDGNVELALVPVPTGDHVTIADVPAIAQAIVENRRDAQGIRVASGHANQGRQSRMSRKRAYRSKMRILADMMRAIQSEGEEGVGPTKILYAANLSHDRLKQYIDELVEKELIKEENPESDNRIYHLTEKGREFLREYVRIERFSKAFGIEI